jgi:hypothetical protein
VELTPESAQQLVKAILTALARGEAGGYLSTTESAVGR